MRRRARPGGGRQLEVTIETLGGRGDGVGQGDGGPIFIAGTLPGDRARVRLVGERAGGFKAELLELLVAGPDRAEPPCPHFGPCGGCSLQHLSDEAYGAWKQDLAGRALAHRGLDPGCVRPLLRIEPGTRRRASVAIRGGGAALVIGFRGRDSHRITDIPDCRLLTPALMGVLATARAGLAQALPAGETGELMVLETESGVDALITLPAPPDLAQRETLAAFAESADLARLTWRGPNRVEEPLAVRRTPHLTFAGPPVTPPPGAFVQPTLAGEAALRDLVMGGLATGAGRIVELFAGLGSFTFALARDARVHAIEGDGAACAALEAAARGLGRLTVERRDLERRPLAPAELAPYDCLVFDPPRAGARAQAERIAQSGIGTVIAVSCNPNSFARDARILIDGGFRLEAVTPLDQFPWSAHLELVGWFRR